MKKKRIIPRQLKFNCQKLFKVTEISFVILLVGSLSLSATGLSQNNKVSIKANNATLLEIFDQIEAYSGYGFLFEDDQIDLSKTYSINVTDESITKVLDMLLEGKGYRFTVVENNIVIRKVIKSTNSPSSSVSIQQNNITITGTVTDNIGEPLPGVSIVVKGTTTGTITSIDGSYTLQNVEAGTTLVFSFIGFESQEVQVAGRSNIVITMLEETTDLNEVVVVGYGTAKKKDITGAISNIKAEAIETQAPVAVQDILRSNAAGLNIEMSTSAENNPPIIIRGKTTLTATASPLYVVDGVIYQGSISDINPSDITSVDILKDASAAAVYGAKSANGVIAITTKKGETGKPKITVNSNFSIVQRANDLNSRNAEQFMTLRQNLRNMEASEEYLNNYPEFYNNPLYLEGVDQLDWYNYDLSNPVSSVTDDELSAAYASRLGLSTLEIENYVNGTTTNWYDLVFRNALQQDYTISVSNKKDDMSYYWSVGYADREGVNVTDEYSTFRTRLNLESDISSFLTIGLNANFKSDDKSAIPAGGSTGYNPVNLSPYVQDLSDDPESPYALSPTLDYWSQFNPFYDALYKDKHSKTTTLNASAYAKINLPFDIQYKINFTPFLTFNEDYNHTSSVHERFAGKGGIASRSTSKTYNWQVDNVFSWKKTLADKHNIETTFLINAEESRYWSQIANNANFSPNDYLGYHRLQAGLLPTVSSDDTRSTGDALMGRLFYSYNDSYMLTATVRRDGYSAFGGDNPRAIFPSLALGWVITNENFLSSTSNWLDYAKIRVSWGENGNRSIGQYAALSNMNSNIMSFIDASGLYMDSYMYVSKMANTGLKWERTASTNIGLDFRLFGSKLVGSVEVYKAITNDLLVNRALPTLTGFSNVTDNLGELENKGLEVTLNGYILKNSNFSWDAFATFSMNRRQLNSLYGDIEDVYDDEGNIIGQKEKDDIGNKWFIGRDPDQIWDYKRDGIYQLDDAEEAAVYGNQPGDFRFIDQDGDGAYTNEDRVFQGYKTPRFRWSLRNDFTFYKNLTFSFSVYSYWDYYSTLNSVANNTPSGDEALFRGNYYAYPYWTPENPRNDYARPQSINNGNIYVNRSFIRLDNINLSYSLPKRIANKAKLSSLRLAFNVKNVGVYTPYMDYFDPETMKHSPRTYSLSVNFGIQ